MTQLGRDDDLVAPALNSLADQLFGAPLCVDVGRVDEGQPDVQRASDNRDCIVAMDRAAEGIAPQANGRNP